MSLSKMYARLQGGDNVGDVVLDGFNTVVQAVSGLFGFDGFPADGVFSAVVLTEPVQIKFSEYEALGYAGGNIDAGSSYYKFKIRIVNKRNNPHAVLEDPCDLTKTEEICQQNGLIAAHTTIVTEGSPGVNIGSFVTIRLDKFPNDNFNLQNGHLVEVKFLNDTGTNVLNSERCASMSTMFENGEGFDPPQMISVDSDIVYLAQKYDENPDIPYKDNHKEKFAAFNAMNSPFPMYFKALAYLAYERDLTGLFFTGQRAGVRSKADQEELVKRYEAGDPGVVAVSKKPGYHGAGLAADVNLDIVTMVDTGGLTYGPGIVGSHKSSVFKNTPFAKQNNNKRLWEATNIVKYIEELGMEWGGNFQSYYDPVHFQLTPPGWDRNDVIQAAALATTTGGNVKYPTKTVQGEGTLGADVESDAIGREYDIQVDEGIERMAEETGLDQFLDDDGNIVQGIEDLMRQANEDSRAAALERQDAIRRDQQQRTQEQHDHYKSTSGTGTRFRDGAARNVDFDKFDVD